MNPEIKKYFAGFSQALLDEIEQNAVFQTVPAGQVIMRTGQYIKSTVLVLSGTIKIYREDDDGGEFLMYYLQPGQACAISMICATRHEKSQIMAKVTEDAELLMVPLPLMDKWMMQHRSWYEFVIETYRSRFEEVLEVIDNIAFRAMDERLLFYLRRHAETTQSTEIKTSHQDIASDLNTSREVISRLLKKMEQRGLVKLFRNQIELLATGKM
ncbi:Crp/Fnr family transcriptional regulator [Flavobacterium sp. CYK-4]|uniref:Crp/Fnr family transcriptional regulator n=1 Tax=Flavobacterium lotistagni TaxID=2709660 RepID=UPI0014086A46|nr:Crp/Fnr family transcriptional regulator [Flavobacterium lotistagni]NHM07558.1 Crp/Fnr family transcriptional regulator [Flavobacterium lotistagni]